MKAKAAAKRFFEASHYGVVGANSDPSRFGYKVFVWYLQRNLPVTPITPSAQEVKTSQSSKPYATISTVSQLNSPARTSLSIITPPKVTLDILADAKRNDIWSVWLQPGTYDKSVLDVLEQDPWWRGRFVGPKGGGKRGDGGWCVLVDGDDARSATGDGGSVPSGKL